MILQYKINQSYRLDHNIHFYNKIPTFFLIILTGKETTIVIIQQQLTAFSICLSVEWFKQGHHSDSECNSFFLLLGLGGFLAGTAIAESSQEFVSILKTHIP